MVDLLGDQVSSLDRDVGRSDDIIEQIGVIYDQLKDGDINISEFIQLAKMVYEDHLELGISYYAKSESNTIT